MNKDLNTNLYKKMNDKYSIIYEEFNLKPVEINIITFKLYLNQ